MEADMSVPECDPCGFQLLLIQSATDPELQATIEAELDGSFEDAVEVKKKPYCLTPSQFAALADTTEQGIIRIAEELVAEGCEQAFTIVPQPTGLSVGIRT